MSGNAPSPGLPEILPVFPLTGVLLLPGTLLPLHVFELRYRNLVEDALAAGHVFGMIQPFVPRQDNRPAPGGERESPALYGVGCAGFIERDERLPDGRFLIELRGLSRFGVVEELPPLRGYRRVRADYAPFAADRTTTDRRAGAGWRADRARLMDALGLYCREHGLALETGRIGTLDDRALLHAIAVALSFHPSEKQALLEAAGLPERERVLIGLLRMGGEGRDTGAAPGGPIN